MTRTPVAPPIPTPTLGSRASVVNVVLVRRAIAPHAGQACRAAPAKSALPPVSEDQAPASPPAPLRVANVALSEVARAPRAASPTSASSPQAETSLHASRPRRHDLQVET